MPTRHARHKKMDCLLYCHGHRLTRHIENEGQSMKRIYRIATNDKPIAENDEVWVGIDVHKTKASVCVSDAHGNVLTQFNSPMKRRAFEALARRLPGCVVHVIYEAGPTGYGLYRWLVALGFDCTVVAPSTIPKRPGEYVKTDRRDAMKLTEMLRGGLVGSIHILTDVEYEHRELVRTRRQLVRQRTRNQQQIKSKLMFHGHDLDETYTCWSNKLYDYLESKPTGRAGIDLALETLVANIRHLNQQIRRIEAAIEDAAQRGEHSELLERLKEIPGVGPVTAMTFVTEIGDISRFETAEKFVSYLGLAPREHTTCLRSYRGGLPRKGNAWIRDVLVQAAWKLIGRDRRLRDVYERIKQGKAHFGAQVAIIGVARRLALAMRAMWRDGTSFDHRPLEAA